MTEGEPEDIEKSSYDDGWLPGDSVSQSDEEEEKDRYTATPLMDPLVGRVSEADRISLWPSFSPMLGAVIIVAIVLALGQLGFSHRTVLYDSIISRFK